MVGYCPPMLMLHALLIQEQRMHSAVILLLSSTGCACVHKVPCRQLDWQTIPLHCTPLDQSTLSFNLGMLASALRHLLYRVRPQLLTLFLETLFSVNTI